jgi:serine/threonine-protein kinase
MDEKGQVSPDGQWFWDGQNWLTTLSPDGQFRWDGRDWVAAAAAPIHKRPSRGIWWIPGFRTGAAWKLPVVAVGFLLLLAGINSAASQPPSRSAGQGVAQASPTAATEVSSSPSAAVRSPSPKPTPTPSPSASALASPLPSPTPQAPATSAPAASSDPYPAATAAGASAVCADGSWSFSKTRSGTCSGHGGVHWWTGNLGPAGPGAH